MAKKCVKDKLDQTLAANLGSAITQVKCDLLKNADKNTRDIMRDHILGGVDKSNPAKMTCMREVVSILLITGWLLRDIYMFSFHLPVIIFHLFFIKKFLECKGYS